MENFNRDIKNNLNNKATIIGSLILVMAFIIIGISTSFAYYTNSIEQKNSENQSLTVNSGGLYMNFETSQYIGSGKDKPLSATLISDGDILKAKNDSYYTAFSINFPEKKDGKNNAASGVYRIYLTELEMTDNYKSEYVKWALCSSTATNLEECNVGNFGNAEKTSTSSVRTITAVNPKLFMSSEEAKNAPDTITVPVYKWNDINLLTDINISKNQTNSYKLYIWLSADNSLNQNGLLSGTLSARVGFEGRTGK